MINIDRIDTKRFVLRKVLSQDRDYIFEILKDEETVKYLNLPKINTLSDVDEIIFEYLRAYEEGKKFPFAIVEKKTNDFVGVFLLKVDLFDEDCYEFTVYINKKHWNRGIYSEVLPEMVKFAFECIGTGNVRGFIMINNKSSARVLKKNSFCLEKTFPVEGLPELIESYLMTREYYNKYIKE